jgi:hypothetical protein
VNWSKFTPEEIERRRAASVSALKEKERAEFAEWYQEQCDRLYWQNGPCCAGCDHWRSDMGNLGHCTAAGIVSGEQVMASLDIGWSTYTPRRGFRLPEPIFNAACLETNLIGCLCRKNIGAR